MFKEFFIKKMLQSKGVPKEQIESLMVLIKKNPALFQQIAEEIQEKMKDAIKILRTAAIYAHRIDWLLSGDDGEESFLERLNG